MMRSVGMLVSTEYSCSPGIGFGRAATRRSRLRLRLGGELGLVLGGGGRNGLEVVLHEHRAGGAGARLGIERRLRLALEVWCDVAGEQLVAAEARGGGGPIVGELEEGTEAAVGLF